ncbi:MAG: hypothetical protein ACD_11C00145G0011 [uncultured bacterium]|nr:MAG: hypothetical protein ACD_11C00145G0011 [uncultured bacterium]
MGADNTLEEMFFIWVQGTLPERSKENVFMIE